MRLENYTSPSGNEEDTNRFSWNKVEIRDEVRAYADRLHTFLIVVLPGVNTKIEHRELLPDDLIRLIQPWITEMTNMLATTDIGLWGARRLLQLLGFVVSSIEKHCQESGQTKGDGLRQIEGLEEWLTKLGRIARHPPRDSHFTAYLWNDYDQPLMYTNHPYERFFIRSVILVNDFNHQAISQARKIAIGDLDLHHHEAAEILFKAAQICEQVRLQYRGFLMKDGNGNYLNMSP